ncbi:hypothetical protein PsorP6_007837 [Peronosclerospora sorghi]|uniref:Uncharacterized protein n=1 Tax=Peronosclerospora sorghi TaxID=230839 RepID=A0ACC0W9K6_9STRA|nr:hypothetical protein PsorP6_007837 [Peronosclerospora sorghi]
MSPIKTVQSSAYAQTHTNSSIINFCLGQPPTSLLPLNMFRSAAMARFSENQDPVMLQYGAAKGFIGFRQEVAKFVADTCSINATHPDTFMVTTGNSQTISHSAMTFSKTKKLVLVEEPTYFLAHDIFRELGLDLEGIYAGKDGIDNYRFHIISDEPYNLFHMNGSAVPPLASYDDSGLVVSLGSFSKILAPGLRLGNNIH